MADDIERVLDARPRDLGGFTVWNRPPSAQRLLALAIRASIARISAAASAWLGVTSITSWK